MLVVKVTFTGNKGQCVFGVALPAVQDDYEELRSRKSCDSEEVGDLLLTGSLPLRGNEERGVVGQDRGQGLVMLRILFEE